MKADVFISHSSKDKAIANAVCHELEENGIKCWIAPRDEVAGEDYENQIISAIHSAKVVVLISSQNANLSQHVLSEIATAFNSPNMQCIIPFRVEDFTYCPKLQYLIGSVHWLDAFPDYKAALSPLVSRVAESLHDKSGFELSMSRTKVLSDDGVQKSSTGAMNWMKDCISACKSAFARYADFNGRSSRKEFWYFAAVYLVAVIIIDAIFGVEDEDDISTVSVIFTLATICPLVAVTIRRLHDIGKSGKMALIGLVPFANLYLLYLLAQPSANCPK